MDAGASRITTQAMTAENELIYDEHSQNSPRVQKSSMSDRRKDSTRQLSRSSPILFTAITPRHQVSFTPDETFTPNL